MPHKPTPHNITPPEAIEAIRVLSALSASIPAYPKPPKFSYGAAANQFKMTADNSLPALSVWLFLVTNSGFLDNLDDSTSGACVPVADISNATNLEEQCVKDILSKFPVASANGTISASDQKIRDAFLTVVGVFQSYAKSVGYSKTDCPGCSVAITNLAQNGVIVDPKSPAPANSICQS